MLRATADNEAQVSESSPADLLPSRPLSGLGSRGADKHDLDLSSPLSSTAESSAPDFVILFNYGKSKNNPNRRFEGLIQRLFSVGLSVQCRQGNREQLLVFVKCPHARLIEEFQAAMSA